MLAAPASQKLYPYHDSPSLLCIYAAYSSPGQSPGHEHPHGSSRSVCECALSRTMYCVEN